jgi:hypothetical protein
MGRVVDVGKSSVAVELKSIYAFLDLMHASILRPRAKKWPALLGFYPGPAGPRLGL